jgi:hypothetical protein
MATTHALALRVDRPTPGQTELLPGCGSRGELIAKVSFSVSPAKDADSNPFVEATVTGDRGALSAPPPDDFSDLPPECEDDPEVGYCFEEEEALAEARAYWRKLLSLGFRPE